MNESKKKIGNILAIVLSLAFMAYAGYKIGHNTGYADGWHGAVEQIRFQAGDVVYPANAVHPASDNRILLDDIENSLPSASSGQ